ncbi:MAG: HDOD domain-containing protein [Gammaproteobacteria bacterium]|nr:HDOD domain-containing protein [Gammaproteobacteria bacterium]
MTEIDLIINQFILEEGKLYTLPELYQQLDEKIRSKSASIDEIGELLGTDAALSAKILKIANSPLYGFRAEVTTLNRALNLIGLKEVKNLILMDTVAQNFNKGDKYTAIRMEDFWQRSVYIALIARKLAKRIKHPEPDRLFVSGIMSRIGQLVCCLTSQKQVLTITHQQQNEPDESEFSIETNILGFSYNEISGKLLKHWNVPEEITTPLQNLHQPLNLSKEISESYRDEIYILHAATVYSHVLEQEEQQALINAESEPVIATSEVYVNKIDHKINQALMIDATVIDDIFFEIEMDALGILGVVFPKSVSIF